MSSLQNNFSLWPWSLALFFIIIIFLLQRGRWRRLAQTIYFFVPEKDVYNFVCILKLYCDTFNLGEVSTVDLKPEERLWHIRSAPQAARSC